MTTTARSPQSHLPFLVNSSPRSCCSWRPPAAQSSDITVRPAESSGSQSTSDAPDRSLEDLCPPHHHEGSAEHIEGSHNPARCIVVSRFLGASRVATTARTASAADQHPISARADASTAVDIDSGGSFNWLSCVSEALSSKYLLGQRLRQPATSGRRHPPVRAGMAKERSNDLEWSPGEHCLLASPAAASVARLGRMKVNRWSNTAKFVAGSS